MTAIPTTVRLRRQRVMEYHSRQIYGPLSWVHVDLRCEHTDDGLGNSTVNYISVAALSLRPNLVLTVEDLASVGKRPTQKYQLLWAGPWYSDRFPSGTMPSAMPMSSTIPMPASSVIPTPVSTISARR